MFKFSLSGSRCFRVSALNQQAREQAANADAQAMAATEETSIQRGSVKTLPYPGDPLTPFEPATKDAKRLDPEKVALPRIPVQPLGWQAAGQILSRMRVFSRFCIGK